MSQKQTYEQNLEEYRQLLLKKRARGLKDLYYFNKFIREEDLEKRKMIVPHVHREWSTWFSESEKRIKCILVPRSCFKSTFFTVGWTLQLLAQNHGNRILIANATLNNAERFSSDIKNNIQKNETYKMLYGDLYAPGLKWTDEEFDVIGKPLGAREPSVTASGVGGNLVSTHFDIILCDDLVNLENSATRLQADKVIDWWKRSLSLLEPTGQMLIIGCLTGDSKVLMADGTWKKIINVKKGEKVWSVDDKTGKRVIKKVEAMIPQGRSKVFEVKTGRHSIEATVNHPFLTITGKSRDWKLVWKKVGELKKGDYVLTAKQVFSDYHRKLKELNNRQVDNDFLWLLGFMFGDGWICKVEKTERRSESWAVCVSKSVKKWKNKKACGLLERYFGRKPYLTPGGYYRLDCNEAGRMFERIGLSNRDTAKTKRIPKWVYKSRPCLKRSFLKGLVCADGCRHKVGYEWRIELSNKKLIQDIKYLALTCGVRPTSIYYRKRMIQAPHSPRPVKSRTWSIGLVFYCYDKVENKTSFRGMQEILAGIRVDKIISIKPKGRKQVFDLTVADTHNFIAEGYVVHNTRWSHYELYSHLQREYSDEIDFYIRSAHRPDGKLYFPERFNEEKLAELKKLHGSYIYSAFYDNNPIDSDAAIIKPSQIKYFTEVETEENKERVLLPSNVNIFMAVDPAISQGRKADFTGLIIVAVDQFNNWYVLVAKKERLTVGGMIDALFDFFEAYKPDTISLEVISQGQALLSSVHLEENRREIYLPIVEIKSQPMIKKETRIRSILQPRFERGKIFIKKEQDELEDELIHFPLSEFDDLIDALAQIEDIAYTPGKTKQKARKRSRSKLVARIRKKNKEMVDEFLGSDF